MPESNIKKNQKKKKIKKTVKKVNCFNFPGSATPSIKKAVRVTILKSKSSLPYDINLVLISDMKIKKMSSKFRHVNKITDVLSFKFSDKPLIGDIYIGEERSKNQAKEQGHSWNKELSYLVIHGVLHLLGFTDYTPKERLNMFKQQDKIFKCL